MPQLQLQHLPPMLQCQPHMFLNQHPTPLLQLPMLLSQPQPPTPQLLLPIHHLLLPMLQPLHHQHQYTMNQLQHPMSPLHQPPTTPLLQLLTTPQLQLLTTPQPQHPTMLLLKDTMRCIMSTGSLERPV